MVDVVEGFHGPGGWAEGLKLVAPDMTKVGIEWDESAVATAQLAGHRVRLADVAAVDPLEFAGVSGCIFSPPCPGFSAAGKGEGRKDLPRIVEMVRAWSAGPVPRDGWHDDRSALTLEVVRWLAALEPEWVALEQVPAVLPVWEAIGAELQRHGYHVWTGLVYAERYGVPQTRVRAVLIASRTRRVGEPVATHQRYYPPTHRLREQPTLEEAMLPRWVSMAQALGWSESDLVGFPRRADTPTNKTAGVVEIDGTEYRERDLRTADLPAFNLTEKARSWERYMVQNARTNATVRHEDEPAPTITAGHDHNERRWLVDTGRTRSGERLEGPPVADSEPAPTITSRADQLEVRGYERRGQTDGRTGEPVSVRSVDDPAPTIAGESRNDSWVFDRPATTIAGDPRVHPPGHKVNADDVRRGHTHYDGRAGTRAFRVSIAEASVLQSFRADYPWQGTKTKQFQQVGNAVPPLLAAAVLREVLGV